MIRCRDVGRTSNHSFNRGSAPIWMHDTWQTVLPSSPAHSVTHCDWSFCCCGIFEGGLSRDFAIGEENVVTLREGGGPLRAVMMMMMWVCFLGLLKTVLDIGG